MATVIIPYKPRYPQNVIHKAMQSHRFVVLVAHRRMGKTVMVINHLIKQALLCKREHGVFAYVAPFRNQAKNIAWQYLKKFTAPLPDCKVNESELTITLPGGAKVRLFGADNADALRGLYFDGVVLDEVAQMHPFVWEEVIRPAIADRQGFAVFIGTPKGINLFSELYEQARRNMNEGSKDWFAALYRADETGAIAEAELAALRAEMSANSYRQEFLCDFSVASDDVLIPINLVSRACEDVLAEPNVLDTPTILGVDVARFGSDSSVIARRQGRLTYEPLVFKGLDNMTLAARVAAEIERHSPKAVFIDAGRGEGVIDRLRQLGFSVIEVNFGGRATKEERYANKRAEMWDNLRVWLEEGGKLPQNPELKSDLSTPFYSFDASGRMTLESKDKMKERLGRSPDLGDALALTFALPVNNFYQRPFVAHTHYDPATYGQEAQ